MKPPSSSPSPFDQEHDVELDVQADGSLATPIKSIESVEEFQAKLAKLDIHELVDLLATLPTDTPVSAHSAATKPVQR